jgi:hypothetical protein
VGRGKTLQKLAECQAFALQLKDDFQLNKKKGEARLGTQFFGAKE